MDLQKIARRAGLQISSDELKKLTTDFQNILKMITNLPDNIFLTKNELNKMNSCILHDDIPNQDANYASIMMNNDLKNTKNNMFKIG